MNLGVVSVVMKDAGFEHFDNVMSLFGLVVQRRLNDCPIWVKMIGTDLDNITTMINA